LHERAAPFPSPLPPLSPGRINIQSAHDRLRSVFPPPPAPPPLSLSLSLSLVVPIPFLAWPFLTAPLSPGPPSATIVFNLLYAVVFTLSRADSFKSLRYTESRLIRARARARPGSRSTPEARWQTFNYQRTVAREGGRKVSSSSSIRRVSRVRDIVEPSTIPSRPASTLVLSLSLSRYGETRSSIREIRISYYRGTFPSLSANFFSSSNSDTLAPARDRLLTLPGKRRGRFSLSDSII